MNQCVGIVLTLLAAVTASEQMSAQISGGPILYRLTSGSSFQRGCFPPCLCPVMIGEPFVGTFVLTPTGFDGLFNTYAVTEVNWLVSTDSTNVVVSGSGTYKIGGEFALQQELSLDLGLGPGQTQHFDSGLVAVSTAFPEINVNISLHGQVCFDTVFSVSASPTPLDEIVSYQLQAASTFQRGCFAACECAQGPLEPILGSFSLVPLAGTQTPRAFAMVNINWFVPQSSGAVPVHGSGIYQLNGSSSPEQQMNLVLNVGAEAATYFDSGVGSNGSSFPSIDVGVSVSGAVCFNTWINLHGAPAAVRPAKARPSRFISGE